MMRKLKGTAGRALGRLTRDLVAAAGQVVALAGSVAIMGGADEAGWLLITAGAVMGFTAFLCWEALVRRAFESAREVIAEHEGHALFMTLRAEPGVVIRLECAVNQVTLPPGFGVEMASCAECGMLIPVEVPA